MKRARLPIIFISCFLLIDCLKEKNRDIKITLNEVIDSYLGKKGTLIIKSTPDISDFDFKDTTKSILFQSYIKNDGGVKYQVDCGLWKEEAGNNYDLYTFCNVKENIPAKRNYYLDLRGLDKITHKDYTITFVSEGSLVFDKYDIDKLDIYSDKQTINVEEGKNNYEMIFKIYSYHQEKVLISASKKTFIFIDCFQEKDDLVCNISKNLLAAILRKSEEKIYIGYDRQGLSKTFPLISSIIVNYKTKKTDIYVGITKLIESISEEINLIAYETNVTYMYNIFNDLGAFDLDFSSNSKEKKNFNNCSFRKYNGFPLLMVCHVDNGTTRLEEITQEIVLDNLNIKYNFRIQPVNNKEIINCIFNSSTKIQYNYPYVLDFTKSDSITVEYFMEISQYFEGATFNENAKDLSCENIGTYCKKCIVPKSHFAGKKNGYYFIKHNNHLGGKSTNYESLPVKVILDDSPWPTDDITDEPTDDTTDEPTDKSKGNMVSFSIGYSLLLSFIIF